MRCKIFILVPLALLLGGCESMPGHDPHLSQPRLDLFDYFEGNTRAWGIFQDRSGVLKRRFVVDIKGRVEGDTLTLDEQFRYADGERSQRVWRIQRNHDGLFTGRAADVVGEASGSSHGSAFNWRYVLRMPYRGSTVDVRFDDWMFLQPDGVLLNRAEVSKFGFRVGDVTLTFRPM